jgi:hypothetical protein
MTELELHTTLARLDVCYEMLKLDVQVFRQSLYERAQEWILGDLGFYHSYVYQRASK